MAFLSKVGSFTISGSHTNDIQSITGLGFQPKAIYFYYTYRDVTISGGKYWAGEGISVGGGTHDNRYTSYHSVIGTTSNCGTWFGELRNIYIRKSSGTDVQCMAVVDAITSDGFDMEVYSLTNTASGNPFILTVNYIAYGGDDLTNVAIGGISPPNSVTGEQASQTIGFSADAILFMGMGRSTPVTPTDLAQNDIKFMNGVVTRDGGTIKNSVSTIYSRNGISTTPSPTNSMGMYTSDTECIALIDFGASITSNVRGKVTQIRSTDFIIDWLEVNGNEGVGAYFLAMKGSTWKSGFTEWESSNTVGYSPTSLLCFGGKYDISTSDTADVTSTLIYKFGAFDAIDQRSITYLSQNIPVSGQTSGAGVLSNYILADVTGGSGSPSGLSQASFGESTFDLDYVGGSTTAKTIYLVSFDGVNVTSSLVSDNSTLAATLMHEPHISGSPQSGESTLSGELQHEPHISGSLVSGSSTLAAYLFTESGLHGALISDSPTFICDMERLVDASISGALVSEPSTLEGTLDAFIDCAFSLQSGDSTLLVNLLRFEQIGATAVKIPLKIFSNLNPKDGF